MDWIINLIKWFFTEQEVVQPNPDTVPEPPKPMTITNREHLYNVAYSCLDKDMAPTQDILGCAEAWSFVAMKAGVKGLPKRGILGTPELDVWLSKNFVRVESPLPGDTVMFPTGKGNGKIKGHVFIAGKHKWMSNNSNTGDWDDHKTAKQALDYYTKYGGISPRYYRWEGERPV